MKGLSLLGAAFCLLILTASCSKDRDDVIKDPAPNLEIENFMYKAMNFYYLYKPDVAVLADDYFKTKEAKDKFLASFGTPEDLYYKGLKAPEPLDRFSFLTEDYRELEKQFAGVSLSNGMDFKLYRLAGGSDDLVGLVRYILPNTSASKQSIQRGMFFTKIDGTLLTLQNYADLISADSYSITLANLTQDGFKETGSPISLTKEEYTENPIFIAETFDVASKKVGYLMYNSFVSNFDRELNNTFGNFKAEGIDALILDLRYNGGGSVRTATDLAAMITGQFPGDIFSTEVFNPDIQKILEAEKPENLKNKFNTKIKEGDAINSLNLSKLYVITTGSSASASELVINGLDPYIEVRQIGTTTVGKFQASITLYDSRDFERKGANPNHFYAIQPLVLTTANVNGVTGFVQGIEPEVEVFEDETNLGVLGEKDELLLRAVLDEIRGGRSFLKQTKTTGLKAVGESRMFSSTYQKMYVENPFKR